MRGQPFPARDLLIFLATGVILFTLVMGASPAAAAAPLPPHEDADPARGAQARARLHGGHGQLT
jgi:CPA1 family monovalent cation:H+ antiporter